MNPTRIELPTPFAVGPVNAYLFTEPEPILVDTGVNSEESWQRLVATLADYNLTVSDLQRVIITHAHVDHFGAAARLVANSRADIYIADLGYEWLLDPLRKWQARISFYKNYFLGPTGMSAEARESVITYMTFAAEASEAVAADRIHTFAVGERLALGGALWDVLHMPGHASHQTCFYQPESQQFISADMLLHKAPTPIVEAPPDGRHRLPSLPIFLESLDRVAALDIETAYPGHGPVIRNHRPLIKKQRDRIHRRKEETLALVRQGHKTVAELVDIMYAHYPPNARFAGLWMLVGYLDLLQAEQTISEEMVDGVRHYRANDS